MKAALLLTLALPLMAFASQAVASIPLHTEFYADQEGKLSAEEIVALAPTLPWQYVNPERAAFGQTGARVWLRFRLPDAPRKYGPSEPLLLEVPNGFIMRLNLYSVLNGKVKFEGKTGISVPVSERSASVLLTGFPVFRIFERSDPKTEYFLSGESTLPLSIPLGIWEARDFPYHHWVAMFLAGLYVGCLFISVCTNALLGVTLRSRLYVTYALFVLSMTLIAGFTGGINVQLLWPESPWWAEREMFVYSAFALIFYAGFLREFLGSRKLSPWLDKMILACVAISTFRSIWMVFSVNQAVAAAGTVASALCNFLALVIAVKALKNGDRPVRFFFYASLVFNVAMVMFILQELNVIWIGSLVTWSPFLGTLIEVVLLGFALADRIRTTNRELARQKAAVVHAEKLGALGRMAGEIAHEINNPLAVIHGNAVMMRNFVEAGKVEALPELARTIEATALRISKVVKGMRSLARDSRVDPLRSTPISMILQDSLALCQDRINMGGVRLEVVPYEENLSMSCRSSEICQVLVNLLVNALDAMDGRPDPWLKIEASARGSMVELAVSDNGPGVPEKIRARIHEPFFTTKEAGKGLGLGLSISRTIIEEGHGGKLWLDETSPSTRFVFSVPRG